MPSPDEIRKHRTHQPNGDLGLRSRLSRGQTASSSTATTLVRKSRASPRLLSTSVSTSPCSPPTTGEGGKMRHCLRT